MTHEQSTLEERIGPNKVDLLSIAMVAMASAVGGFIAGAFIFVCSYFFLNSLASGGGEMFPFILSVIGFFACIIALSFTLMLQRLVFSDKYRAGITIFSHVYLIALVCFLAMMPVYVIVGRLDPYHTLTVLVGHILLTLFGATVMTEVVASYRYALLGIYASFIGLLATAGISIFFADSTEGAKSPMFSMVLFILIATVVTATVRVIVEWVYYRYYLATGTDPLGDVFASIEREERADMEEAEDQLVKFK